MNIESWFKRIPLIALAGFFAYDAVQSIYTGVVMHRYCAAEARYELYPNVELDDSPEGYCNTKPYPCESTVQEQLEFIPIAGVMNSEQWIYIVNKRQESVIDPKRPYRGQAGFFRRTNHYFDLQGRPLAKYVYFEPNGETFTPLGTMLYEKFAKTEGRQVSLHGCSIRKMAYASHSLLIKES